MDQAQKAIDALRRYVASASDLADVFGSNIPSFDRARLGLYTPFRLEKINLGDAAGASALGDVRNIAGDFLYIDPASTHLAGSMTIEMNDATSSDLAPMTANPGFATNAVFKQVKFRYTTQPGKIAFVLYSTGYSVIPTFSGTPLPLDPEYARFFLFGDDETDDGEAFDGFGFQGAVVGQLSHLQLRNATGSNKVVYVDGMRAIAGAAPGVNSILGVMFFNTALSGGLFGRGQNKKRSGAVSLAEVNQQTSAAPVAGQFIRRYAAKANDFPTERIIPPFKLDPGEGVVVFNGTANADLTVEFDFREK
jgi:hypothetical protein